MPPEPRSDYVADVLDVRRLSPSFVRVELGGRGLDGFASLGIPDEGCVFQFPGTEAMTGRVGRWYTVRGFDQRACRMTVDFVVHRGGIGGEWASVAKRGDRLRIVRQDSWYRRPERADWQLLVGDLVAIPAFARIAEETAAGIPTRALVEVPEVADQQPLDGAQVTWLHNPAMATGDSALGRTVRELALPHGPGYVYVAGEAAATRSVRGYLRHELGLPSRSYGVIGYWRAGVPA
jgi:NADPH-dependent ferric siderophore reductase